MLILRQILTLIVLLGLTACAANGIRFTGTPEIKDNKSQILIYRPDNFARGGNSFYIHIDGNQVATLKNAGYVALQLEPGKHVLQIKSFALDFAFKTITTDISLESGETKYYRLHPHITGAAVVTPQYAAIPISTSFFNVPEEVALQELPYLRLSE
jgi:hypothetical protein